MQEQKKSPNLGPTFHPSPENEIGIEGGIIYSLSILEPQEHAGLPDGAVPDEDHLDWLRLPTFYGRHIWSI